MQENKLGNERLVKAFYSGYRNLGNLTDDEMKNSFTLTEIPPQGVKNPNKNNTSNLLVPEPYEKQWVDLKLMMVNYAIFYAAMIPRADSATSGACDISKVAIPVPGYPMGFYKNPDVVTYYAVKGEAEFLGMFNPFRSGPVKLNAYAAAKPFGGRIGPMLFTQKENQDFLVGRTDNQKFRSVPYITSYDFRGVTIRGATYGGNGGREFIPGLPLPTNSTASPGSFWLTSPSSPLGGLVADAAGVQFGVPNLVFDYQNPFKIDGYSSLTAQIHSIKSSEPDTEEAIGLFSKFQFNQFRGGGINSTITPEALDHEIARVRAPTTYEASNYMIPTPHDFNNFSGLDSFGFIAADKEELPNKISRYRANIYAPLYRSGGNDQTDLLYTGQGMVQSAIFDFMRAQISGMTKYKMALNRAAIEIDRQKNNVAGGAQGSRSGYERAANGISDIDFTADDAVTQTPKTCNSIAGQFLYFYYGGPVLSGEAPADSTGCPTPLGLLLEEYFATSANDPSYDPTYYAFDFSWNGDRSLDENLKLMTAYLPGPFTGVGQQGSYSSPIPGSGIADEMRRNTYSTKFITLDSLQTGGGSRWDNKFPMMSEGDISASSNLDTSQNAFRNPLNPGAVDADISTIKY